MLEIIAKLLVLVFCDGYEQRQKRRQLERARTTGGRSYGGTSQQIPLASGTKELAGKVIDTRNIDLLITELYGNRQAKNG